MFNVQYLFNEIDSLKSKQFKNENIIIELKSVINNLESCIIKPKEAKLTNKIENSTKSLKKCHFYNIGYCRSKSSCTYHHPKHICQKDECSDKECPKRHLKMCKNWVKSTCKFGKSCEYKHDPKMKKKDSQGNVNKTSPKDILDEINTKNDTNESFNEEFDDIVEEIVKKFDTNNEDSLLISEDSVENFSCDNCENTETSEENLKQHVQSYHEEIQDKEQKKTNKRKRGNVSCDICEFVFQSKTSLNKHVKDSHESKKLKN